MDSSRSSKRMLENESPEENASRKKPFNTTEFSTSEIIADSTHLDVLDIVDSVLKEQNSIRNGSSDCTDNSLLDTIVEACNDDKVTNVSSEEHLNFLKGKLRRSEDENRELKILNSRLLSEIEVLKEEAMMNKERKIRYERTIIRLNDIAKVTQPSETEKPATLINNKIEGTIINDKVEKPVLRKKRTK